MPFVEDISPTGLPSRLPMEHIQEEVEITQINNMMLILYNANIQKLHCYAPLNLKKFAFGTNPNVGTNPG